MEKITLKRIGAYLIDIFVVSMLITLVSQINFINPSKDKLLKVQAEYQEYYDSNLANLTTESIEDVITDEYVGYVYDIQYYSIANTVADIAIIVLYFTLFPYFNNDQTIGKRLFKIKVTSDSKKVRLWQYLVRSLFTPIVIDILMSSVLSLSFNILALFIFKGKIYMYATVINTYLINIVCYVDIFMMFKKKEHKSLHDLIAKTKVEEIC